MRKAILKLVAGATTLGLITFSAATQAQVTTLPINNCLAGKIKSVGKSLAARTKCFSQTSLDPVCSLKASNKFTGGTDAAKGTFNKLEEKYPLASLTRCLTFGDQGSFETAIASYVATVVAATGAGPGKCDGMKIKCIGKYVAAVAKCDAKAAKTGTIDSACTGKAAAKLVDAAKGCLDKAALAMDCTNAGNQAAALQGAADAFVQESVCTLAPGNVGCIVPSATPTHTPTETATQTPTETPTQTPTVTATACMLGSFPPETHPVTSCSECGDALAVSDCLDDVSPGICRCIYFTDEFNNYLNQGGAAPLYESLAAEHGWAPFDPTAPDGSYEMISLNEYEVLEGIEVSDHERPCFAPVPRCR